MLHLFIRALHSVFGGIGPRTAGWFADLFQAVAYVVQRLEDYEGKGKAKREKAVRLLRLFADEAFDRLPWWGDLTEDARDRILDGAVELALSIHRSKDDAKETASETSRKVRRSRHGLELVLEPVELPIEKLPIPKTLQPELKPKTAKKAAKAAKKAAKKTDGK